MGIHCETCYTWFFWGYPIAHYFETHHVQNTQLVKGIKSKNSFGKWLSISFKHQHKQAHTTCLSHLHARISWQSSSGRMHDTVENICYLLGEIWPLPLWTLTSHSPCTWTAWRHSSGATTTRDVKCFSPNICPIPGCLQLLPSIMELSSMLSFQKTLAVQSNKGRAGQVYPERVTYCFTVRGQTVGSKMWDDLQCASLISLSRSS